MIEAGKKYKHEYSHTSYLPWEVLFIGNDRVFIRLSNGQEVVHEIKNTENWVEVKESEYRYFNVYKTFISQWAEQQHNGLYPDRKSADSNRSGGCIAVCRINLETGQVMNEQL